MTLWNADRNDCGPVVLALIATCHGLDIDLDRARALCETTARGTNFLQLKKAAEKLGFQTKAARVTGKAWDSLERLPAPFVAQVLAVPHATETRLPPWDAFPPYDDTELEQFVVVERVTKTSVFIIETGVGPWEVPRDEFVEMWTDAVLLLVGGFYLHESPSLLSRILSWKIF